jgi:hypothetical protein
MVKENKWDELQTFLSPKKQVAQFLSGSSRLELRGNTVVDTTTGNELHGYIVDRIIEMAQLGLDSQPLINFYTKLLKNPSFRAVNEFYPWLEKARMPIAPDGDVFAYKKVRSNYRDIHSGTMDNSVGNTLEVPRNTVDEDASRTCSHGLHVCSKDYLPHFGSSSGSDNRVLLVKFSPEDVVAIPADYNDTKMRVCKYTVVEDVTDTIGRSGNGTPIRDLVYDPYGNKLDDDDDDDDVDSYGEDSYW